MNKSLISICFFLILFSCSSKSNDTTANEDEPSDEFNDFAEEENVELYDLIEQEGEDACKFEDGTYSATVDYYNPETNYSNTYNLDVEVQDCQIVQINFPNDGWLDEDHISATELDENGNAVVEGENGKSYEIQIDY